jgi:hypothetical protein
MSQEIVVHKIRSSLEGLTLHDKIAVLANVLVQEGYDEIGVPPADRRVSPENVFMIALRDRHRHGETIGNALVMQGLTMLDWLAKRKNTTKES